MRPCWSWMPWRAWFATWAVEIWIWMPFLPPHPLERWALIAPVGMWSLSKELSQIGTCTWTCHRRASSLCRVCRKHVLLRDNDVLYRFHEQHLLRVPSKVLERLVNFQLWRGKVGNGRNDKLKSTSPPWKLSCVNVVGFMKRMCIFAWRVCLWVNEPKIDMVTNHREVIHSLPTIGSSGSLALIFIRPEWANLTWRARHY